MQKQTKTWRIGLTALLGGVAAAGFWYLGGGKIFRSSARPMEAVASLGNQENEEPEDFGRDHEFACAEAEAFLKAQGVDSRRGEEAMSGQDQQVSAALEQSLSEEVPLFESRAPLASIGLTVPFPYRSAEISEAGHKQLAAQVPMLLDETPDLMIQIAGFTSATEEARVQEDLPADYAEELAQARAKAIFECLVSQGVPPSRMSFEGFGTSGPLNLGDEPVASDGLGVVSYCPPWSEKAVDNVDNEVLEPVEAGEELESTSEAESGLNL